MEEKIKQINPELHRYLFTVTTFSKLLAMFLFILLPFVGFYLGMQYQQKITTSAQIQIQKPVTPTPILNTFIKITSPVGGEVWVEGKTYNITWSSSGVKKINISAVMGGHDLGHIAFGINASIDKYSWTIPVGEISGFGQSSSNDIKVRVEDNENTNIYAENDIPFTIVSTNSKQSECNTNSDCQSGAKCTIYGPLIANQPPHKVCVSEGQMVPLLK